MDNETKNSTIQLIKYLFQLKANQGYAVKSVGYRPDYNRLVVFELSRLEKISPKYEYELKVLSNNIRRFLFGECNSAKLYNILYYLNEIYTILFSIIESVDLIIEYIAHLSSRIGLINDINIYEKMIDDVYLANAKVIIGKKWNDVLSSDDDSKTFIELFDDIFTNAIEQNESDFLVNLSDSDILCRMVKEKECNEDRFIPWPNKTQNRWNPPGKTYLYLSYGTEEYPYNDDLSITEYICLLECRTAFGDNCCFAKFEPLSKGRILDLSYNDVKLEDYRNQISDYQNELEQSILNKLINDTKFIEQVKQQKNKHKQEELVNNQIKEIYYSDYSTKTFLNKNLAKQLLKMICQSIYTKVDKESEEEKEKAYRSFHLLSEYLENKGITGIIYPCTRTNKVVGKNIVLFNVDDAKPIKGSIKKYHCTLENL